MRIIHPIHPDCDHFAAIVRVIYRATGKRDQLFNRHDQTFLKGLANYYHVYGQLTKAQIDRAAQLLKPHGYILPRKKKTV